MSDYKELLSQSKLRSLFRLYLLREEAVDEHLFNTARWLEMKVNLLSCNNAMEEILKAYNMRKEP